MTRGAKPWKKCVNELIKYCKENNDHRSPITDHRKSNIEHRTSTNEQQYIQTKQTTGGSREKINYESNSITSNEGKLGKSP